MRAPDKEVLEAIISLRHSNPSAFESLEKYIEDNRDYFNGIALTPRKREDELLHWTNVGATMELKELSRILRDAHLLLRSLQEK